MRRTCSGRWKGEIGTAGTVGVGRADAGPPLASAGLASRPLVGVLAYGAELVEAKLYPPPAVLDFVGRRQFRKCRTLENTIWPFLPINHILQVHRSP